MTIREHDPVVLTRPLPAPRLDAGTVGTVVHVYGDDGDPTGYEVAFGDGTGDDDLSWALRTGDIRLPTRAELEAAARALARGGDTAR